MFVIPDLKPDEVIMYLRKSRTDDSALTVSENPMLFNTYKPS